MQSFRPIVKLLLIALYVINLDLSTSQTSVAQKPDKLDWPILRIPNGVTELPADLEESGPFDMGQYFGLDDADNREQLYLQVFVESAMPENRTVSLLDVFFTQPQVYHSREFQKRYKKFRKSQRLITKFIRDHTESRDRMKIENKDIEKGRRLTRPYVPMMEKLKLAQTTRDRCVFHPSVFHQSEPHNYQVPAAIDFYVSLILLRYQLWPASDSSIEELGIGLTLTTDIQPLGSSSTQNTSWRHERRLLQRVVKPMLESPLLTEDQLDRLIEVLAKHCQNRQKVDPAIEAARYQYLISRQAFLDLRDKRYRANPVNPNRQRYSEVDELNHVYGRFSQRETVERLKANWANSNRPAAEKSQIAEIARTLDDPKQLRESYVYGQSLRKFLADKITAMTRAEFARDLNTLIKRYREIEAACELPYPESNKKLAQLANEWTTDGQWKSSFLFLWSDPRPIPDRALRQMYANAYLAAAVTRKWRLENDGNNPPIIEDALKAAGIDLRLVDPCSGKPLRLQPDPDQANRDVVIYSVGEDGKDQNGKQIADQRFRRWFENGSLNLSRSNDVPDGDLVFRFRLP